MKSTGDQGELKFASEAMKQGIYVSKPFSSVERYDFITDYSGILKRVQVKASTYKESDGRIEWNTNRKNGYKINDFDFYALIYEDMIFIVPKNNISGRKFRIGARSKHKKYLNAWNQLKG